MKSQCQYTEIPKNKSQYEGKSFQYGSYVDAVYVKPLYSAFEGNRLIEALPLTPDLSTTSKISMQFMPGYKKDPKEKSTFQKVLEINQLENVRFPLPLNHTLWEEIYVAMAKSYNRRTEMKTVGRYTETVGNEEIVVGGPLYGDNGASVIGINLIGESGSGKTSAIKTALDYYPRVIRHDDGNGVTTIQIPYLFITCTPHSNFKVLYSNIGEEIDKYLGNTNATYKNRVEKASRRSLTMGLDEVKRLIETFHIGLIVFDEFQMMSFDSNRENSFDAIMTLENKTGVAVALIGTTEVIEKIAVKEQYMRRLGKELKMDAYKTDDEYFKRLFAFIEQYQWFNKRVKFSDEMKNIIFTESHGIVAYIVMIYQAICYDYIFSEEKNQKLDCAYIHSVIDSNFAIMKRILNNNALSSAQKDIQAKKEAKRLREERQSQLSQLEAEQASKELVQNMDDSGIAEKGLLCEAVVSNILAIYSGTYTETHIREVFEAVYPKNKGKTEQQLSKAVMDRLLRGRRDTRNTSKVGGGKKKFNIESTVKLINESAGDPNHPL